MVYKSITIFTIIAIIITLFLSLSNVEKMIVVSSGNIKQKPLNMEIGKFQDSDCGMIINNLKYTSQVISQSGKTWFFHDHGGMVHWLEDRDIKNSAKIWVKDTKSGRWIDGRTAWYSRDESTPMNTGFGAYSIKKDRFITFNKMKELMLRGETMSNPYVKKRLLGEY